MKLVRVISKDSQDTANFANLFTDQITIDPYSQVALINASLSLTTLTIDVTSANNTFSIQNSRAGGQLPVSLKAGTYSDQGFLNELNRAMNTATATIETQWKASMTGSNILSIEYGRARGTTS